LIGSAIIVHVLVRRARHIPQDPRSAVLTVLSTTLRTCWGRPKSLEMTARNVLRRDVGSGPLPAEQRVGDRTKAALRPGGAPDLIGDQSIDSPLGAVQRRIVP